MPDFINMKAEGNWSNVDGKAFFSSPLGTSTADDANFFVPENFNSLDNSQFWRALVS